MLNIQFLEKSLTAHDLQILIQIICYSIIQIYFGI